MKVLLVANAHLYKCESDYYSPSIYNYNFLKRYLNVFEEVKFLGKVRPILHSYQGQYEIVSGIGVEVCEIPWYKGIKGLLFGAFKLLPPFAKSYRDCDCIVYRMAQMESIIVYLLGGHNKPYVVELVNDPEAWSDMPKILRHFCVCLTKRMIRNAKGVSFVTQDLLQKKYADKEILKNKFVASYSSVELNESVIAKSPMKYPRNGTFRIIHVSNLINNDMKGHKTVIEMAKLLNEYGVDFEVVFLGEGEKIDEFERLANELGVGKRIHFIGRLSKQTLVFEELRKSSIMVFPSATEGLPRALIEAMAVGLPCLSTPVGGIPELLDSDYLFAPYDSKGYGEKIIELINNPSEMEEMSRKNIERAREFSDKRLSAIRTSFYRRLRECSE